MAKDTPKTFSDQLGIGEFHPDLPRIEFKDLLDRQVLVVEAMLIEDFTSKFGTHDCLLILVELDKQFYTTITSGEVVIKRIMKAQAGDMLPLLGTFTKGDKEYYNIL